MIRIGPFEILIVLLFALPGFFLYYRSQTKKLPTEYSSIIIKTFFIILVVLILFFLEIIMVPELYYPEKMAVQLNHWHTSSLYNVQVIAPDGASTLYGTLKPHSTKIDHVLIKPGEKIRIAYTLDGEKHVTDAYTIEYNMSDNVFRIP
jgi:hypothetical protein